MEPGTLVDGRYRLEAVIGAGGMGIVWQATHEALGRRVALKQIPLSVDGGEDPERIRARTLREARNTARLDKVDGVVRIGNYFHDERNVWLELEYVDALNLGELITATGGLPPAEVAWIGARVARALAGGHELDTPIQHRDVKPGNILISRDGTTVRLGDYGISRREGDPDVTLLGTVPATLSYAAPEVVSRHTTTIESDIWSLGATLYHAVEGRPPYGHHDSTHSLVEAVRGGRVEPVQKAGPDLQPLLERMLVLNPDSRIDADSIAEKLERIARPPGRDTLDQLARYQPRRRSTLTGAVHEVVGSPTPPLPPGPVPRAAGWFRGSRGRPLAVALTALTAVAALAAVALITTEAVDAAGAPSAAGAAAPTSPPPSDGRIVIGDPRTADPCSLVDLAALGRHGGNPEFQAENSRFSACRVTIRDGTAPDPKSHDISLYVEFWSAAENGPLGGSTRRLGPLTVARYDQSSTWCPRDVQLSDGNVVVVYAEDLGTRPADDLCAIADTGTTAVVNALFGKGIGARPRLDMERPLAKVDACTLLAAPDLAAAIPGYVADPVRPSFGSWGCEWGAPDWPRVSVEFHRRIPLDEYDGVATTFGGRPGALRFKPGKNCMAQIVQDELPPSASRGRRVDVAKLLVSGSQPEAELCGYATALANAAAPRLPPPG